MVRGTTCYRSYTINRACQTLVFFKEFAFLKASFLRNEKEVPLCLDFPRVFLFLLAFLPGVLTLRGQLGYPSQNYFLYFSHFSSPAPPVKFIFLFFLWFGCEVISHIISWVLSGFISRFYLPGSGLYYFKESLLSLQNSISSQQNLVIKTKNGTNKYNLQVKAEQ